MMIIAIDPGLTGAMAALDSDGSLAIVDCPVFTPKKGKTEINDAAIGAILKAWVVNHPDCHVFLERAQFMPGQGGSSSFNYGTGYGVYRGVIAVLNVPHTKV